MLQTLAGADLDLGGEPVVPAEDGCADDGGECRFDQGFPADDD
jgi:hypothetical protein